MKKMKTMQLIIIPVALFSVIVGIVLVASSDYDLFQNLLYPELNLLDGYWFTTATPTPIPTEIKFRDNGTFVVTIRYENGDVDETYVGTYDLDMADRTLEMDLNSTVIKLSLYDV